MLRAVLLIAPLLTATPVLSAAPAPGPPFRELAAVGPWAVDYGETQCALTRTFGTGEQAVVLRAAKSVALGTIDMVIAGPGLAQGSDAQTELTMRPSPGREVVARGYRMALNGQLERFVRWYVADDALANLPTSATSPEIEDRRNRLRLGAANLSRALTELNHCQEDLRRHWNVRTTYDVSTDGSPVPFKPTPLRGREAWVVSEDMSDDERPGEMVVNILVAADGRVVDCAVETAAPDASLTARTCGVIRQRARFEAARDAAGQPTRGVFRRRIIFTL